MKQVTYYKYNYLSRIANQLTLNELLLMIKLCAENKKLQYDKE